MTSHMLASHRRRVPAVYIRDRYYATDSPRGRGGNVPAVHGGGAGESEATAARTTIALLRARSVPRGKEAAITPEERGRTWRRSSRMCWRGWRRWRTSRGWMWSGRWGCTGRMGGWRGRRSENGERVRGRVRMLLAATGHPCRIPDRCPRHCRSGRRHTGGRGGRRGTWT